MPNTLKLFRASAFLRQHGRRIYFYKPIWLLEPTLFAVEQRFTIKQAVHFRYIAVHLCARKNDGNTAANIAAAYLFCNLRHHSVKLS